MVQQEQEQPKLVVQQEQEQPKLVVQTGTGATKTGGTTGTGAGKLPVSSQANSCNPASATLSIKAKGPQVTNLQNILIKSGYSVGSTGADGDFGPNTQAAVKKFQQDKHLCPTGTVDSITWKALCGSVTSAGATQTPSQSKTGGSGTQLSTTGAGRATKTGTQLAQQTESSNGKNTS